MTNLLLAIVLFIVWLIPQAFVMNGIFLSASGNTDILPDNTIRDSEMILYPLNKYLNQKTMVKIYYSGDQLTLMFKRITDRFPVLNMNTAGLSADDRLLWLKHQNWIKSEFAVGYDITNEGIVMFYMEYPKYRFSKYIRKPIIGCIICMPSFWGIFTFVIPGLLAFHFDLIILALYIPNALCLAYLNYKIFKPL